MNKEQLEESNRKKYGQKEHDVISNTYRRSKEHGDVWCERNIHRYLDRFVRPGSSKGGNMTDLYKAKDYLERMIEENEKLNNQNTKEIIE